MKRYSELILFLSTTIFGVSYVFLNLAGKYLPPFTINTIRFFLGVICFLPFCFKKKINNIKKLVKGSILLGLTITVSPYFQQLVANDIPAGKIGFISSMYLVMVPLIEAIIYHSKISLKLWCTILLTFLGLFVLCGLEGLNFDIDEIFLLIVALFFAFEILIVDKFSKDNDPLHLMCGGFIICLIINSILALCTEKTNFQNIQNALPSLLFLGLIVSFLGYGFQGIGQKNTSPLSATLIMSLESVISVIAGWLFLNQILTFREIIGCVIMFIGVLSSELIILKSNK